MAANHPALADLLTRAEAAAFLNMHERTLWDWTQRGRFTSIKIGRRVYYRRQQLTEEFDALIEAGQRPATAAS